MSAAPPPWTHDHEPLAGPDVERVLAAQRPDLVPVRAERLGSGWDFDAWLVNDTWVVRFPRRTAEQQRLARELHVLPGIAAALDVAVPRYEIEGHPSAAYPYRFGGYRYLPGVGADRVPDVDVVALGRDLGAALARVHVLAPEPLPPRGGVTEVHTPADWLPRLREWAADIEPAVPADLRRACAPFLAGDVEPPAPYGRPPCLVHDDLGPEHLLLDPATGRLTAIIDWGDVAFGDPVADFVGVVGPFGWPIADAMRTTYGDVDAGFAARLAYAARMASLLWLGETRRWSDAADLAKHQRWLRNVFT